MMRDVAPRKSLASHDHRAEPRWPAVVAILAAGLVYGALPQYLAVGPRWLLIVLIAAIELPAMITLHTGHHRANQILGYIVSSLMTFFLLWSLMLLVVVMPAHKEPPIEMLGSGAILWAANVLTFALWYWRLDGGGPLGRDRRPGHVEGAFLFPQMTWERTRETWSPTLVDYLFLAFNTSTAFSPTDTPILSRWAKLLVIIQSCISLTIIALLIARAVNTM